MSINIFPSNIISGQMTIQNKFQFSHKRTLTATNSLPRLF